MFDLFIFTESKLLTALLGSPKIHRLKNDDKRKTGIFGIFFGLLLTITDDV